MPRVLEWKIPCSLAIDMTASVVLKFPVFSITEFRPLDRQIPKNHPSNSVKTYLSLKTPRFPRQLKARTTLMEAAQSGSSVNTSTNASMKLLFVEMGVGYDQHGCVKTLTLVSSFYSWVYLIDTHQWFLSFGLFNS